jgi:hypothetical protein
MGFFIRILITLVVTGIITIGMILMAYSIDKRLADRRREKEINRK